MRSALFQSSIYSFIKYILIIVSFQIIKQFKKDRDPILPTRDLEPTELAFCSQISQLSLMSTQACSGNGFRKRHTPIPSHYHDTEYLYTQTACSRRSQRTLTFSRATSAASGIPNLSRLPDNQNQQIKMKISKR